MSTGPEREAQTKLEGDVDWLIHYVRGNGKPSLEEKLKEHAKKGIQQAIVDIRHEMDQREERQDLRHVANTGSLEELKNGQNEMREEVAQVRVDIGSMKGASSAIKWGIPIIITLILAIIGFFIHEKASGQSMISMDQPVVAQSQQDAVTPIH